MSVKDSFILQTQKLIEDWQAQLAEYTKNLETAKAQTKAEYEKVIAQATVVVKQAQAVNEQGWNDMEAAIQNAFDQLRKGWQKALSRYK